MSQKTFTQKLIDLMVSGDMPKAKGSEAAESGLIIAISKDTAPVCGSYGSSIDMTCVVTSILEQSEPVRMVLSTALAIYAAKHPDDPRLTPLKEAFTE